MLRQNRPRSQSVAVSAKKKIMEFVHVFEDTFSFPETVEIYWKVAEGLKMELRCSHLRDPGRC